MTEYFHACDLCNSLSFEPVKSGADVAARRCRECGTIVIDSGGRRPKTARAGVDVPGVLPQLLKKRPGMGQPLPTLVIGELAGVSAVELSGRYNLQLTMLAEATPESLANVPFLPDQFDMVLCAMGIEYVTSPASLFRNIRRWLAPSGVLVVGGANAGSLSSRLRAGSWVRRHAAGAVHLLGAQHLKVYAEHFGFELRSLRTSSSLTEIASTIFDNDPPSVLSRVLSAPIALVTNAANLGDRMTAVCIKRGIAVKPMLRPVRHETERDTGLAPALFTSIGQVKREMV